MHHDIAAKSSGPPAARLVSLDAYRGAIMLLMASGGLGLARATRDLDPGSPWKWVGYQVEHAEWAGATLWDFIQPGFMFMVGVALPWSLASRAARGQRFGEQFVHALWRSLVLVLLAVFLTSAGSPQTNWVFTNVLAQIGLGYPFLFLLAFTRPRAQWLAAAGILVAYWLAFALHPLPASDFNWKAVGVPDDWPHLAGFAAHWEKNANFAAAFDRWFLNLFPRPSPFVFSEGGYQTLNFIPSLATMIFGMQAGRLLRSELAPGAKVVRLVTFGLAGIALGTAIAAAGLCPIVKRIWTPSWAIFSAGGGGGGPGGLLRDHRLAGLAALELPAGRRRDELDCAVCPVAVDGRIHQGQRPTAFRPACLREPGAGLRRDARAGHGPGRPVADPALDVSSGDVRPDLIRRAPDHGGSS